MKSKIKSITFWNAFTSLLLQLVTIVSGFIIPRLILKNFGSEVNGLISSLNQFLNYVTILEGGLSSVILANLYKPLYEKNHAKINSVIKTTQKFYQKLATIFIFYALGVAILYPIIFNVSFTFEYVFTLTLILAINLFIQYNFSISWKLLLNADKKVYIVSISQIVLIILNTVIFAILIRFFPSIHFLKLVSALVYLLQPIIYHYYIKKYFKIDKRVKEDKNVLKSRWDGFSISIATFIHKNTDITILTFFTNLKIVSIYSVYSLVTNGIKALITSLSSGIIPTLGQLYAKNNKEELNKMFNFYEYIIFFVTFLLFTVGSLLVTSFVSLYTKNINDVNYYQPLFGVILLLSEAVFCLKEPFVNLAYSAGKFKSIKKHAYIEATINIVLSIILVNAYGLIGVAIGTLVAMSYRTIYHIVYLKKNLINRNISIFLKKLLLFGIATAVGLAICLIYLPIKEVTLLNWVLHGILYTGIFMILYLLISVIFYKEEFAYIKDFFKNIAGRK